MTNNQKEPGPTLPAWFSNSDISWIDKLTVQCPGVRLRLTQGFKVPPSTNERITLFKDPQFVQRYLELLDGFPVANLVEVGIWDGGSAIFFWNLLKPEKLCCIELKESAEQLKAYIERRQLLDRFRLHLGVDQADRERLAGIIAREYAGSPLDLIIDDASHLYGPSKVTFEALFPSLREGGLYVLEDWKTNLIFPCHGGGPTPDSPPLHQLAFELLELSLRHPAVIPSVRCFHNFVLIERGPEPLQPLEFRLEHYQDKNQPGIKPGSAAVS